MAPGMCPGVSGVFCNAGLPYVHPGAEVGALRMAAVQGTSAAGWLAIVGCNREEVTTVEIREAQELEEDCREAAEAALYSLEGAVYGLRVVTLDRVKQELAGDEVLRGVKAVIEGDLEWPQQLGDLRRFRGSFSVVDGVLMYGD